ncbi:hypothetical protein CEXT_99691 [Caerostris extrusa]|uniref:Uncharacterized protein n=1 Tax=Caerostris extrusa TaxID=172846 RepID=A0AAV4SS74_CAEEX|nr:hypothetical protein CEXT_99691 [Caerostris extrusa]
MINVAPPLKPVYRKERTFPGDLFENCPHAKLKSGRHSTTGSIKNNSLLQSRCTNKVLNQMQRAIFAIHASPQAPHQLISRDKSRRLR